MLRSRCDRRRLYRFYCVCDCIAAGVSLFTLLCVVIIKSVSIVAVTVWTTHRLCANSNDIRLDTHGHIGLVCHTWKSGKDKWGLLLCR